jgi:hypothetical protein
MEEQAFIEATHRVVEGARRLAMLGLQSKRYETDEEFRKAVDKVLALSSNPKK